MVSYQKLAKDVTRDADIVLLVVDARDPETTSHPDLVNLVKAKKLLYVINKIDLVPEEAWSTLKRKLRPSVAVSSTQHLGTMMLLRKINALAHGAEAVVAVIGYPNTGKSSLINALRGRGSASVSPVAGHTKAIQKVRVSSKIVLLDSPGVLMRTDVRNEEKADKLAALGTIDVDKLREPDLLALKLLHDQPGLLEHYYGVPVREDKEASLEAIAVKKRLLSAGGQPDVQRAAKMLLRDYTSGKIMR